MLGYWFYCQAWGHSNGEESCEEVCEEVSEKTGQERYAIEGARVGKIRKSVVGINRHHITLIALEVAGFLHRQARTHQRDRQS